MPRTEEANQRIREEQRAKILNAAIVVFAQKGMAATMSEIATTADVSYGLVYRYFVNKEALLAELIEKVLSDSRKALEEALEMPGTPGERLRSLLTQILTGVREHPEFIMLVQQMLVREAGRDHPHETGEEPGQAYRLTIQQVLRNEAVHDHLRKLAQEQSQTYRAVLKQLVVEGQASGEVALNDPDQLVAVITACVAGLSQSATWQAPEQFQKTFPDVAILFRMFDHREEEKKNA